MPSIVTLFLPVEQCWLIVINVFYHCRWTIFEKFIQILLTQCSNGRIIPSELNEVKDNPTPEPPPMPATLPRTAARTMKPAPMDARRNNVPGCPWDGANACEETR